MIFYQIQWNWVTLECRSGCMDTIRSRRSRRNSLRMKFHWFLEAEQKPLQTGRVMLTFGGGAKTFTDRQGYINIWRRSRNLYRQAGCLPPPCSCTPSPPPRTCPPSCTPCPRGTDTSSPDQTESDWNRTWAEGKKQLSRKRTVLVSLLDCLRRVVVATLTGDMLVRVLVGEWGWWLNWNDLDKDDTWKHFYIVILFSRWFLLDCR